MNGVKGWVNTLNEHRGRVDALHEPIDQGRIDRETLRVMMEAMEESFPAFRRYFKAKASRFGQEPLTWWNLFAPVGKLEKEYTFAEAANFILKTSAFSPRNCANLLKPLSTTTGSMPNSVQASAAAHSAWVCRL